jgi:hypothetical protein
MRYQNGDRVLLLENMSFKGGGKGNPIAHAEIIGFNKITENYTIRYEVMTSGETGQIEVPEERLTSKQSDSNTVHQNLGFPAGGE